MNACATCPARLTADALELQADAEEERARLIAGQLELQADFAEEVGAALAADRMRKLAAETRAADRSAGRMRARAAEIRAAGCSWWWRIDEENRDTGQTRTVERCGAEALPHFLKSYGMDLARSANVVREDHQEIARAVVTLAGAMPRRLRVLDAGAVGLLAGAGDRLDR